jgi:hypothetical protein
MEIEDDTLLMQAIDYYAKLSRQENYTYKFIEIMKNSQKDDVVYIKDVQLLEKIFRCPIRQTLIKLSAYYLGTEITSFSECNRFLGHGKKGAYKINYQTLRSVIINQI